MEHHFDIDIASEYGIAEAVLINHFQFWIAKNKANGTNFHDGRHWTFNSQKAMLELFPYLSRQSLRTVMQHLTDKGVIIIGNYNETQYDRTSWYAFVDEEKWLSRNQPMHWLESTNGMAKSNQPIPYKRTDNNTPLSNDNTPKGVESEIVTVEVLSDDELIFDEFRKVYKGTKRGLKTEFANFKKKHKDWSFILPVLLPSYEHQQQLKEQARSQGCFVPEEKNLQTYINQRCWEEEPQFTKRANQANRSADIPDWMTPEGQARQRQMDNLMNELWNH